MPLRLLPVLLFSILIVVPVPTWCQEVHGGIEGLVVDDTGAPLAGVEIEVTSARLQRARTIRTNPAGHFRLLALPVGTYEVQARSVGRRPVTLPGVRVSLGVISAIPTVTLERAQRVLDTLRVLADRPPVDLSTAATRTNLGAEELRLIPGDRSFRDALRILPHTVESARDDGINVAGSTGLANLFFIDGVNTTNPYLADGSTELPNNFVEEIQLLTGGYEAEYGEALGAIVNVVTRSGGNAFEGSIFAYLRNHSLSAEERFGVGELTSSGENSYDVGFTLGGPIVRDRLWFFAGYDPRVTTKDVLIPDLNVYSRDKRVEHRLAGKLTWSPTPATRVVASLIGDPVRHDRVQPGPFTNPDSLLEAGPLLNRLEEGGVATSLIATHDIGGRWLLEAKVGYQYARKYDGWRLGGDQARYSTLVSLPPPNEQYGIEIFQGGFGEKLDTDNRRLSGQLSATLFAGDHAIKAGAKWEAVNTRIANANADPGVTVEFGDLATTPPECRQDPALCRYLVIFLQPGDGEATGRYPSAFLQDSWSITRRLRLNIGVRWDAQYFLDNTGRVAQSVTDEWQPRFGVVYAAGPQLEHKIFASAGRFYEQTPMRFLGDRYNGAAVNGIVSYDDDPRAGGQPVPGTEFVFCCDPQARIDGLQGTHFDEGTLGYEGLLAGRFQVGVRGIYRTLRQVLEGGNGIGNPGLNGSVADLEKPERVYKALELRVGLVGDPRYTLSASYVLSRNAGNYPGIFDNDQGRYFAPNDNRSFRFPEQMVNNDGVLPNDETHAVKVWGAYRFGFGLTASGFFNVHTGTPVTALQIFDDFAFIPVFPEPRGARGRTQSVWDLDLRLRYALPVRGVGPSVTLDVENVFNRREVLAVDPFVNQPSVYGNPDARPLNPTFLEPTVLASPRRARLGVEVLF